MYDLFGLTESGPITAIRVISFSSRLISAFVFNAWVVVDLPIMNACKVHDGLRLTWLDTPKTDVLAIVQADQRLLVSAKQLI